MAQLPKVFNQDVPTQDYQPLPEGTYTAEITDAQVKESKSGGHYLNVRYDIIAPSHQGRVVYGMITINANNPKAVEIGEQQMNRLRLACGIGSLTDTNQLIGKKVQIKLKIEKSDEYGDQNRISSWKAVDGSMPPMPSTDTSADTTATEKTVQSFAEASTKAPWE
jgi:hypothetical protein